MEAARKRARRILIAVGTLAPILGSAQAGRVAVEVTASGQQFLAVNASGAAMVPRVIVRGWTDREAFPPRHAAGLALNGVPVAARMLTGATWIYEPDGTVRWGYLTGFAPPVEGAPADPRLQVFDHDKNGTDHWPPRWGGRSTVLALAVRGQPQAWTYRVDVPPGVALRRLEVAGNASQFGQGTHAVPVTQILADPEGAHVVAERRVNPAGAPGLPHVYEDLALPPVWYLRFTADQITERNRSMGLYHLYVHAEGTLANSARLELAPGTNVVTVTDHADSSHAWRVLLEHDALRDNPPPPTHRGDIPEHVTAYRSRFRNTAPQAGQLLTPEAFFPLGVYGPGPAGTLDFRIDDLVDHHCNAVYKPGHSGVLADILDLCERAGLRVIYQGSGSGTLLYQHSGYFGGDADREVAFNRDRFLRLAPELVPPFRDRWGLLAWSLGEEVEPDVPQRMAPYYRLMRELDPTHPPVFLHNNFQAAENDLTINRPAAVTYDLYAYALGLSGPTTTRASVGMVLGRVARYRRLCDAHDVPLWFMGQATASAPEERYDRPPYGRLYGARQLSAPLMRMQGWAAIAEGARGLFFFNYQGGCRDAYWRETPMWESIGQLFAEIQPLAPLLLELKRTEARDGEMAALGKDLLARTFVRRGEESAVTNGLYAVILNLNGDSPTPAQLTGPTVERAEGVWDLKSAKPVSGALTLQPGEGTLLWIGNRPRGIRDPAARKD